jgi:hypothetical protein
MIKGRNMFLESSESLLKTNPVERICSMLAAMNVDKIHIIDSGEIWKEGKGNPFIILAKKATARNKNPIIPPNAMSEYRFFLENPIPLGKDFFSVRVI